MRKSKFNLATLSIILVVSLTSFVGGYALKKEVVKKEYTVITIPKTKEQGMTDGNI